MNNICILDCTLRDGGYINDWNFGYTNITSMLRRLTKSGIDIVECGFLEDTNSSYNKNQSLFTDVDQIKGVLPYHKGNTQYVAMTRYGFLNVNNLKEYNGHSINGIRITFHEDEVHEAIEYCRLVKEKGYRVYVQPVGTTGYSDKYLLKLIEMVNELSPYAFYIVDTLGLMKKNDVLRMFYLLDNNLHKDIIVGFHSHNNLQLSFSNSQELIDVHTRRTLILDSSVYGMGRGAGNLNTELIAQHLNAVKGCSYNSEYLLEIIDESISPLLEKHTWGYSAPYYLAAINSCHPNYASYLMNRKTLPVKSIGDILRSIDISKRELYSETYISELYTQYQQHLIDDSQALNRIEKWINDREIIVIAPGGTIKKEREQIKCFIREKEPLIISVNFDGDELNPHILFFSNAKRYRQYTEKVCGTRQYKNTILTSNIQVSNETDNIQIINYTSYLNDQPLVNDNATLMLLKLLIKLGVREISIAGFDGYGVKGDHYIENALEQQLVGEQLQELNKKIAVVVNEMERDIRMEFLTDSFYKQNRGV